jgi:hypothetical protein
MRLPVTVLLFLFMPLISGAGKAPGSGIVRNAPIAAHTVTTPAQVKYTLTAWSELGMHCMDGKEYAVFSVLPPFNTVHAQLLKQTDPPIQVTSGVTITYEAVADPAGSINTISSTKTDFWDYVQDLFLQKPAPDVGISGNYVQSLTPRPLAYNSALGNWEVTGIPTVPYDDHGAWKPYPMAKIVAKDASGAVLATAKIVVPVSDELNCKTCHASNSDPYAKPNAGWVNNSDPAKDTKLNILRKHDDRFDISGYLDQLAQKGYVYQSTLEATANSGTSILCAVCHSSNALGTSGLPGINPLTQDMHTLHGPQINLKTGKTLDLAKKDAQSCYLCHPGVVTKCKRGAMNKVFCLNCHGNVSFVGGATRTGWLTEPSCQMCHQNGVRYTSAFDVPGHWRDSKDAVFATNNNVPMPPFNLYRFSTGHGKMYCSTCHGSQHAEFPTIQANDNVYSKALQGYKGQVRECGACHTAVPLTKVSGPHGIHTVGQTWVNRHGDYAEGHQKDCQYCHGTDYRGTALTKLLADKRFNAGDYGIKNFSKGHTMNCYDCHNGPNPN